MLKIENMFLYKNNHICLANEDFKVMITITFQTMFKFQKSKELILILSKI